MAVNISKTKYIIFRTRGKKIDQSTLPSVVFNNNEIGLPNDQSKIFKLERVFNDNPNIEHKSYKLLGVYLATNGSQAVFMCI